MSSRPPPEAEEVVIPVVEEQLHVERRQVDQGGVRVHIRAVEDQGRIEAELAREDIEVRRVPQQRQVEQPPPPRREGETLIISVAEQRLVTRRVWVVTEEIHLTVRRSQHTAHREVTRLRQQVTIEPLPPEGEADEPPEGRG